MRLRLARKIWKAIGEEREHCYRKGTLKAAMDRYESTESSKAIRDNWHALMKRIGPEGRAFVIRRSMPAAALRILCEEVEELSFSNYPGAGD